MSLDALHTADARDSLDQIVRILRPVVKRPLAHHHVAFGLAVQRMYHEWPALTQAVNALSDAERFQLWIDVVDRLNAEEEGEPRGGPRNSAPISGRINARRDPSSSAKSPPCMPGFYGKGSRGPKWYWVFLTLVFLVSTLAGKAAYERQSSKPTNMARPTLSTSFSGGPGAFSGGEK